MLLETSRRVHGLEGKMSKAMAQEAYPGIPNVVTDMRYRELLEAGFSAELLCRGSAYKKAGVWYGLWTLDAVSPDGSKRVELAFNHTRSAEGIRIREFKTVNGIVSYMSDYGFKAVSIPMFEGERTQHQLP